MLSSWYREIEAISQRRRLDCLPACRIRPADIGGLPVSAAFFGEISSMTRAGAFGKQHGRFLRQQDVPPSLVTNLPGGNRLAVTETRNENPVPGISGRFARE